MTMSSNHEPPDNAAQLPSTELAPPSERKRRVAASATTLPALPAASDTIPLPSTRTAGFRAPEEGSTDRPFEMGPPREVGPFQPASAKSSRKSGPRQKTSLGVSSARMNTRKR